MTVKFEVHQPFHRLYLGKHFRLTQKVVPHGTNVHMTENQDEKLGMY